MFETLSFASWLLLLAVIIFPLALVLRFFLTQRKNRARQANNNTSGNA